MTKNTTALTAFQKRVLRLIDRGWRLKNLAKKERNAMHGHPGFVLENPPDEPIFVPNSTVENMRAKGVDLSST